MAEAAHLRQEMATAEDRAAAADGEAAKVAGELQAAKQQLWRAAEAMAQLQG